MRGPHYTDVASRVFSIAAVAILALPLLLALTGCSQVPEPEENIDSLTSVTEAPVPPDAAEEYDAELHPEPIVESVDCSRFLVITVRGTGEPSKGQLLSPVARAISKALPGSVDTLDLDYPADTDVNEGGTLGVRMLIDTLNLQTETCPDQRFALLGYSQGALIIGDALADADSRVVGATVGALSGAAETQVVAIVLYGNPRFAAGENYDVGDYDEETGGILPRAAGGLQDFEDRLRDYCVSGDFICQNTLNIDEQGHVAYFDNGMQEVGAEFVISLLKRSEALSAPAPSITGGSE
jgi:hypothetical protein